MFELENFQGVIIGAAAFLIIGLFHPIVVKTEYYFGTRLWYLFLILGVVALAMSVALNHSIWSPILGVFGFSSFWTIKELFEQRDRVSKGWFPRNPKRKD